MEARAAQAITLTVDRLGVSQSNLTNHTVCCTQAGKGMPLQILGSLKWQLEAHQVPVPSGKEDGLHKHLESE